MRERTVHAQNPAGTAIGFLGEGREEMGFGARQAGQSGKAQVGSRV